MACRVFDISAASKVQHKHHSVPLMLLGHGAIIQGQATCFISSCMEIKARDARASRSLSTLVTSETIASCGIQALNRQVPLWSNHRQEDPDASDLEF